MFVAVIFMVLSLIVVGLVSGINTTKPGSKPVSMNSTTVKAVSEFTLPSCPCKYHAGPATRYYGNRIGRRVV